MLVHQDNGIARAVHVQIESGVISVSPARLTSTTAGTTGHADAIDPITVVVVDLPPVPPAQTPSEADTTSEPMVPVAEPAPRPCSGVSFPASVKPDPTNKPDPQLGSLWSATEPPMGRTR